MKTWRAGRSLVALLILAIAGLAGAWVHAQVAVDPPYTTFVYRGYLERDATSVTATLRFQLRVFGARSGGTALTTAVDLPSVMVAQGYFALPFVLPAPALTSPEVWLEIAVDDGSGLVTMGDRQRFVAMPYATMAASAVNAKAAERATRADLASAASDALRTEIDGLAKKTGDDLPGSFSIGGDLAVRGTLDSGCQMVSCSGPDWVECSCPAGTYIKTGGCIATTNKFVFQGSLPLSTTTWQCGGHNSGPTINLICCRQK